MGNKGYRFWLGLAVIIFFYGGFFVYFCIGKPGEPNNVVVEQVRTTIVDNIPSPDDDIQNTHKANVAQTASPEVYLCKMVEFYQQIITILFF